MVDKTRIRRFVLLLFCLLASAASVARAAVGDSKIATWKDNAKAAYSLTTDGDRPSQVYTIAPALMARSSRHVLREPRLGAGDGAIF